MIYTIMYGRNFWQQFYFHIFDDLFNLLDGSIHEKLIA
uniref:Uncharacterized protein n=1 Tax=Arundo donax TaxID=35708 RepID=A0A0A9BYR1_ARUDO